MKIASTCQGRPAARFAPIFHEHTDASGALAAAETTSDSELLDGYSQTVAAVANRVAPSVVNIRVEGSGGRHGGGSGFVIARDGFILTNSHVVAGASQLEVTLHDARTFPAQLIGHDPDTDIGGDPHRRARFAPRPAGRFRRAFAWDKSRSRSAVRTDFSRPSRPGSSARSVVRCARNPAG